MLGQNTIKTLIRTGLQSTRRWLEEDAPKRSAPDSGEFAYPWLNSVFTDFLKQGYGWRSHFTWGVLQGAYLAKALGIQRISIIEFGVAGGNGLVCLEQIAESLEEKFDIGIDVYGFDTGRGLPPPTDYRDLPNLYREAAFPMDVEKLEKRLKKARLVLGLVGDTVSRFIEASPDPVGFISFDMDYYSSTMQAFKLFEADQKLLLPRVHCYFDDIMGFTFSEFTGERRAIADFNGSHQTRKISPIYGLHHFLPAPHDKAMWPEMMFMTHIFDHERYGDYDGLVRKYAGGGTDLSPERILNPQGSGAGNGNGRMNGHE